MSWVMLGEELLCVIFYCFRMVKPAPGGALDHQTGGTDGTAPFPMHLRAQV